MIADNRGIVNSKKKKHCNLRSRNYDDGESAKDVVCKKVVSQGVEGQSIKICTIKEASFLLAKCSLRTREI